MSDPTNPLDWAEYTENDWEAAKLLFNSKKPSTTAVRKFARQWLGIK